MFIALVTGIFFDKLPSANNHLINANFEECVFYPSPNFFIDQQIELSEKEVRARGTLVRSLLVS